MQEAMEVGSPEGGGTRDNTGVRCRGGAGGHGSIGKSEGGGPRQYKRAVQEAMDVGERQRGEASDNTGGRRRKAEVEGSIWGVQQPFNLLAVREGELS